MKKYVKNPIVIEAVKLEYDMNSIHRILSWIDNRDARPGPDGSIIIPTLEGEMIATTGDYIIKGIKGEFYPCKPDIFKQTYSEYEQ